MVPAPVAEGTGMLPSRPNPVLVPEGFSFTEAEVQKLATLARMLHCTVPTASNLLVHLLRYIQENPRGLRVVQVPEVLAQFSVKWGYKKKRNDFLKLLIDLDFIYVAVNYWAKIRAKKYALGKSGKELMDRLANFQQTVIAAPVPLKGPENGSTSIYPGLEAGAQTPI